MRKRRRLALARAGLRRPSAALRRPPEFLIIGAQRAGTSSMFRYLGQHPQVRRPLRKEIDYFSANYGRPPSWYAAHFPLRVAAQSFDCTPQYLVHPLAAGRCHALLPNAKLVVMVRDPVTRLVSQYSHMRRLGFENLTLREALTAEDERTASDLRAIEEDPGWNPRQFFRFGYLARSRYAEQMQRWLQFYPHTSIHVFDFDEFVGSPESEWTELVRFLELDPWAPDDFRNWSQPTVKPPTDPVLFHEIRTHLGEDIDRFKDLAGRPLSWV